MSNDLQDKKICKTSKERCRSIINELYSYAGYENPIILIFSNPLAVVFVYYVFRFLLIELQINNKINDKNQLFNLFKDELSDKWPTLKSLVVDYLGLLETNNGHYFIKTNIINDLDKLLLEELTINKHKSFYNFRKNFYEANKTFQKTEDFDSEYFLKINAYN